ncbi:MAG: hypothetical protein M3327_07760 [Actinomycetota bacterium]|nr:hypothetical protein [Actinomycetota bacterium]
MTRSSPSLARTRTKWMPAAGHAASFGPVAVQGSRAAIVAPRSSIAMRPDAREIAISFASPAPAS